jgi:hypothetical protein
MSIIMPPPMMKPPSATTGPQSDKPKEPNKPTPPPPIDPKLREQRIAEKRAKYVEILNSVKYHPPETAAKCPDTRYSFEVLKGGAIVDKVKFSRFDDGAKSFFIVGRVPACDIVAENPTVSRTHAVLQFIQGTKAKNEVEDGKGQEVPTHTGLYLYDLGSTHGTYINKNQVFPNR